VSIRSSGISREVVTDRNGEYELQGLPLGAVSISVITPFGFGEYASREFEVTDLGACSLTNFTLRQNPPHTGLSWTLPSTPQNGAPQHGEVRSRRRGCHPFTAPAYCVTAVGDATPFTARSAVPAPADAHPPPSGVQGGMSVQLQMTGTWFALLLCLVLACNRPPSPDEPNRQKDVQHAQPEAAKRPAQPSEPVKPMKIGGEVSAPTPRSRLNIRWPGDPTDCYELGIAVFEGVVDRNGSVRDVKLVKGPDNEFTRAAREAIAQQKFEPAMYRGKPVDVTDHVSVNHVPLKRVKGPC